MTRRRQGRLGKLTPEYKAKRAASAKRKHHVARVWARQHVVRRDN